jgi:outer membrane protein OmpA-like peptidoglycan-associated protein
MNPVDWWHGLEGGRIAETRPPPPNADEPYPTLGVVPPKPAAPDAAMHARIASALVADRGNAQYTQKSSPILPAQMPAPTPPSVIAQGTKPADGDQPNAALAAANAPPQAPLPQAPVAAKKAPVAPVSAAPLDPLQPPPAPAPAAADAAPMPAIPDAPPAPPQLAGVAGPPAVTAPTPPVLAPPPPPPVPGPNGPQVPIPFAAGSAVLPADALAPLKSLAKSRGLASIAVTGFGEATSSDPAVQAAALPLALDRARAVAAQLQVNGVPASAVRIAAEPQGSGAAARLVN